MTNEKEEIMTIDNKLLPISIQKEFTFNLAYAFPLCVLLGEHNFWGWYYENYIEHYFIIDKDKTIESGIYDSLEYGGIDTIDLRFMEYFYIDVYLGSKIDNINYMIDDYITNEYRIVIFLDEYYLSNRSAYKNHHYVHEFLLYGFDKKNKLYNAVAFQNQIFSSFTLDYSEVESAFISALYYVNERKDCEWIKKKVILCMKPIQHDSPFPFSIRRFYSKLCRYSSGSFSSDRAYFKSGIHIQDMSSSNNRFRKLTFGIETSKGLSEYIKSLYDYLENDKNKLMFETQNMYGVIHLFRDHRYGLEKRFQFITSKYDLSYAAKNSISQYSNEIACSAEISRQLFFKLHMYCQADEYLKAEKCIRSIEDLTSGLCSREIEILNDILLQLSDIVDSEKKTYSKIFTSYDGTNNIL